LNKLRLKDNSPHEIRGKELELRAKSNFEKAGNIEKSAPEHDRQLLFNALDDANNLILKAHTLQENAIAIYQKDPEFNLSNYKTPDKEIVKEELIKTVPVKEVESDTVLFPVYVEQYNPLTDPNLYISKSAVILPRLKLAKEDLALINEANRKNQYANDLLRQVDAAYIVVDSLNYVADRTPDFATKDKIRNEAIEKEQTAFYKLTNATNIFIDVNQTSYKIYKNYFPKTDPKKISPEIEQAKRYEASAEEYFSKAKTEIAQANRQMFRSEQYIQLMGANDMLLYALQLQENAYGIYLNAPELISAKTDTSVVTKNTKSLGGKSSEKEKQPQSSQWKISSVYTYSKEKPKAAAYKAKPGVIFTVQLGVFKGIVPAEKLGNVQPLIFDEFADNPNRRFMAGEYRTAEAAEAALEVARKAGYPDAYILSLIDGQRKSYTAGKENLKLSDAEYNELKKNELAKISGNKAVIADNISKDNVKKEPVKDEAIKTGTISGNNIKNTKGLVYLVQLGMFAKPVSYAELKDLQPIYTEVIPGKGTRYMLGTYPSLSKAREESQQAVAKGISDAYVVAYLDGRQISLEKAREMENKQGPAQKTNIAETPANIIYMVQVGAYRDRLGVADEGSLKSSFAPNPIELKTTGGMNLYLLGNFKTYKEADALKKKLIAEGHSGVFVVAFNGDQKIPVAEAIKMGKN
jgi:hypothetical protein